MGESTTIGGVARTAAQRLADLVNGVELAPDADLDAVAQRLRTTREQIAPLVGKLRDDDARASVHESRAALAWLERTKQPAPTLDAFRRHAAASASARARLREALEAHPHIGAQGTDAAYRDVIAFVERYPKVSLDGAVDAYLLVLAAVPVEQASGSAVSRAWGATTRMLSQGPGNRALDGLRVAHEAAEVGNRDIRLAAQIYAAAIAYGSASEAEAAVQRGLGRLLRAYPSVPVDTLTDAWIGLIAAHRSVPRAEAALEKLEAVAPDKSSPDITAWMRAYAIIQSAEGRDDDNVAVLQALTNAPPELRRNPEALATAYAQVLASEHNTTAAALHAMTVLLRWTPADVGIGAVARVHMALRGVVGHTEALARTLYLLEKAGTPVRVAVLERLAAAEVQKARASRSALEQLGTAVLELPQRAIGWMENRGRRSPTDNPDSDAASAPSESPDARPSATDGGSSPMQGRLPNLTGPATTSEGLALYAPGSVYRPRSDAAIDLFERAAVLAGVPRAWARSEGLHNILERESRGGVVGIPNYTYGVGLSVDAWRSIHADLRDGRIRARSSATGLGQLLLRNVDVYYPNGRDGLGVPLQEAAGMLAYIKDRYGNPDNAWRLYGKRHEGY